MMVSIMRDGTWAMSLAVWNKPFTEGGQGEKHKEPAWSAYRVLYRTSQNMCPAPKETLLHQGRSPRWQSHGYHHPFPVHNTTKHVAYPL
jgi:hypothetical protein